MSLDLITASDAELIAAVDRRDEAAMRELYERHGRAVFGLSCRALGDTNRAEEVLQDVFVRLWQRPERFDPNRGELRSFLLCGSAIAARSIGCAPTAPGSAGKTATSSNTLACAKPTTSHERSAT
jgi:RNA polymerase sigma-70 factor (ECF subfamily)